MSKKLLMKLINSKQNEKKNLYERSKKTENIEELRSINDSIETIQNDIDELTSIYNNTSEEGRSEENWQSGNDETREEQESGSQEGTQGKFNPVATFSNENTNSTNRNLEEDIFGTIEYRQAFKNHILAGTPIPPQYTTRSAQITTTSDLGAVIPTTILNRVIEDITSEGKILKEVTQTSYQGGVSIPISEIMPEATWIQDGTSGLGKKEKMSASLTFNYNLLEAKVSVGLLAATTSLQIFENTVVRQLKKAMIKAIERSIISGTGSGQPKGVTKLALPEEQIIKVNKTEIKTVETWSKIEGMVPEEYEDGNIYLLNKQTWENYVNGMTDANGQRIGLADITQKNKKVILGRDVITTAYLPAFDKASDDDVIGIVINLAEYLLNSNLQMFYKKYYDENTNSWVSKALMIVDGKMAVGTGSTGQLVGAKGIIYIKKNALTKSSKQLDLKKLKLDQEE